MADKYQNLMLPIAERLFPSMREVQRQNIITEVLPPLVEVPFGQDVSKYVFFPKKEIDGMLPGYSRLTPGPHGSILPPPRNGRKGAFQYLSKLELIDSPP